MAALASHDYEGLDVRQRVAALNFLCHLVLDGPTVRAKMDARAEEGHRLKKHLIEEAKVIMALGRDGWLAMEVDKRTLTQHWRTRAVI